MIHQAPLPPSLPVASPMPGGWNRLAAWLQAVDRRGLLNITCPLALR
jgi:hypothetical protein